jgi:microcystin-dependent protein
VTAGDGKLRVKTAGISSNELATDSVTTAKIKDGAVTSDKLASTAVSAIMPTGTVIPFAGSTLPGNTGDWLFCDGSEYSETGTYSNLFSIIGSVYTKNDETPGHFRVPDLRGRVVAGKDNMGGSDSQQNLTNKDGGIDGDTLGATGGHEEHLLLSTQSGVPAHVHKVYSAGDGRSGFTAEESEARLFHENAGHTGSVTDTLGLDGQTGNNDTADASTAHNNVQPTIILNYIIKT